jgi:hypothetical protein
MGRFVVHFQKRNGASVRRALDARGANCALATVVATRTRLLHRPISWEPLTVSGDEDSSDETT